MWNKMNSTNKMRQTDFSIEVQQDCTRFTEVTALPPLFDWKLKLAHFYSRKYKIKVGSRKEPQPSRVLYIGSRKKLNDYYAPRV
jgi:hypothetical protein